MTTPTITSYPTLPATWTPPSSCLASTAYYYAIWGTIADGKNAGLYYEDMLGIPTPAQLDRAPAGPCVPPAYTTDRPYLTDGGCPAGYSVACATGAAFEMTVTASSVTCCSRECADISMGKSGAYSFNCDRERAYGCLATILGPATLTGFRTDLALSPPTGRPETRTIEDALGLVAWGIRLISTPSASSTLAPSTAAPNSGSPASATSAGSIPTEQATSGSAAGGAEPEPETDGHPLGLSRAATAGIGVGAAVGALLLALVGWLFYRKGRKDQARRDAAAGAPEPNDHAFCPGINVVQHEAPRRMTTEYKPPMRPMRSGELHADPRPPAELYAP